VKEQVSQLILEATPVAADVGALGESALVRIVLDVFVPSGRSDAIESSDNHDDRYLSALSVERGLFCRSTQQQNSMSAW
jgi:hypothetical protein